MNRWPGDNLLQNINFFKLSVKKYICNELNSALLCISRRETPDKFVLLGLKKEHKSDMKIGIQQSSECARNC